MNMNAPKWVLDIGKAFQKKKPSTMQIQAKSFSIELKERFTFSTGIASAAAGAERTTSCLLFSSITVPP